MTARRRSLAVVAALVVWAVFVSAAFGSRVLVVAATDCCNPPGNPLDAPGVYGLIAQHGGMTRQEVTQKVHAAWRAFLVWALRRTWVALVYSLLVFPLLIRWLARRPPAFGDLYALTLAALLLALLSPMVTVPLLA